MKSILESFNIKTGQRTKIAEFDYLIEAPNWSSNGEYLIYNSKGNIYKYDLKTGKSSLINTDYVNRCNNDHVLSPDCSQIGLSHNVKEDGRTRIFTVPLSGGVPTLITPLAPSYLHGWSPDGEKLVYCAMRNGDYDIYTMPACGGNEIRLTNQGGLNDGPEYDPKGKYIWFNSLRTGMMQVWRMKEDGSQQEQMTFDLEWNTWFPHVSPDGKKVVMLAYSKNDTRPYEHVANRNVELRLMNTDGSNLETVVKLFGGQGTINVNSWAPDGEQFAFVSYEL